MRVPRWISHQSILCTLIVVGCATGAAFLIRGVARAREAARSAMCVDHFKAIGIALLNYESTYGSLPPAYIADARGKPLHSWRVLILPFIGAQDLYDSIRLDEPWDGPNNRKLRLKGPPYFFCPSDPESAARGFTSVLSVRGPGTLFPGAKARRLAEISDDPNSTVMLVESDGPRINWMEPRDLDWNGMSFRVNDRTRPSISSPHHLGGHGGPHVATADDAMASLPDSTPSATIRAMLTIDDGVRVKAPLGPWP